MTTIHYPEAIGCDPGVVARIEAQHGHGGVLNPIIWRCDGQAKGYIYVDEGAGVNRFGAAMPTSRAGRPQWRVDLPQRQMSPGLAAELPVVGQETIADAIRSQGDKVVDIDYLWRDRNGQFQAIELTRFQKTNWRTFGDAKNVVSTIARRPSWRGPEGPVAMRAIIEALEDLSIAGRLVVVGADWQQPALVLPLTSATVDALAVGWIPSTVRWMTLDEVLHG